MYELQSVFDEYSVPATVMGKTEGSRITVYEFQLHPGARKLTVTRILSEIGVRLGAESIRLIEIPERNAYGIEVSNKTSRIVRLNDILRSDEYRHSGKKLKFIIGESPDGRKVIGSLVDARHLLIAGSTGAGKSVFLNVLLMSLLQESPTDLKLILIDPKRIELSA